MQAVAERVIRAFTLKNSQRGKKALSTHRTPAELERFRAKWAPICVKKTRQTKIIEPASDSIRSEKALAAKLLENYRAQLLQRAQPPRTR